MFFQHSVREDIKMVHEIVIQSVDPANRADPEGSGRHSKTPLLPALTELK
jgi:hypothetical protein